MNRQFRVAARPVGMVKESDFEYAEVPVPELAEGELLVRTTYLSLDPSMRGQMENRADYVAPLALGEVTGEFTPDDLLGEIFGRFCIGK